MDRRIGDPHGPERHFLAFSGASLVVAGLVYLLFPHGTVALTGIELVLAVSTCLALARVYGFLADGGPGWFNTVGVTAEAGFAAVAAILLGRREQIGSSAVSTP